MSYCRWIESRHDLL